MLDGSWAIWVIREVGTISWFLDPISVYAPYISRLISLIYRTWMNSIPPGGLGIHLSPGTADALDLTSSSLL
jgi:hypothetical protein